MSDVNIKGANVPEEFRSAVAALNDTITASGKKLSDMDAETKSAIDKINQRLDTFEFDSQTKAVEIDPAALAAKNTQEFEGYLRAYAKGDRKELASKSYTPQHGAKTTDNHVRFVLESAGALLIPDTVTREIIKNVTEYTPIMDMARVTQIGTPALVRRARTSTPGLVILDEEATSEKKKIKYKPIRITPKKAGATYSATHEQMEDMDYSFATEITEAFREDADVTIGSESLRGTNGLMSAMIGNISNFNSGGQALTTNMLIAMQESLKEPYQRNGQWLFTRKTRGYIRALVLSATNGLQYTWEPDFQRRGPTMLLGSPVRIANEGTTELPTLASLASGNFTAGNVPVLYGDFRQGYEIAMRRELMMLEDPYSEADQWVTNFHIMFRIGGGVIKEEAIAQMTITTS